MALLMVLGAVAFIVGLTLVGYGARRRGDEVARTNE
jgi:hypothetical protein